MKITKATKLWLATTPSELRQIAYKMDQLIDDKSHHDLLPVQEFSIAISSSEPVDLVFYLDKIAVDRERVMEYTPMKSIKPDYCPYCDVYVTSGSSTWGVCDICGAIEDANGYWQTARAK